MDDLAQLFTLSALVFCLMVWALVLIQRRVLLLAWKNAESNRFYRELFLPLGPIATGGLLAAFVSQYPFPEMFGASLSARIFFGVVCGLASSHAYRILKSFLMSKSAVAENSDSE